MRLLVRSTKRWTIQPEDQGISRDGNLMGRGLLGCKMEILSASSEIFLPHERLMELRALTVAREWRNGDHF